MPPEVTKKIAHAAEHAVKTSSDNVSSKLSAEVQSTASSVAERATASAPAAINDVFTRALATTDSSTRTALTSAVTSYMKDNPSATREVAQLTALLGNDKVRTEIKNVLQNKNVQTELRTEFKEAIRAAAPQIQEYLGSKLNEENLRRAAEFIAKPENVSAISKLLGNEQVQQVLKQLAPEVRDVIKAVAKDPDVQKAFEQAAPKVIEYFQQHPEKLQQFAELVKNISTNPEVRAAFTQIADQTAKYIADHPQTAQQVENFIRNTLQNPQVADGTRKVIDYIAQQAQQHPELVAQIVKTVQDVVKENPELLRTIEKGWNEFAQKYPETAQVITTVVDNVRKDPVVRQEISNVLNYVAQKIDADPKLAPILAPISTAIKDGTIVQKIDQGVDRLVATVRPQQPEVSAPAITPVVPRIERLTASLPPVKEQTAPVQTQQFTARRTDVVPQPIAVVANKIDLTTIQPVKRIEPVVQQTPRKVEPVAPTAKKPDIQVTSLKRIEQIAQPAKKDLIPVSPVPVPKRVDVLGQIKKLDLTAQPPQRKFDLSAQASKKMEFTAKKLDVNVITAKRLDLPVQPKKPELGVQSKKIDIATLQPVKKFDLNLQPSKKIEQVALAIKKLDLNLQPSKRLEPIAQPIKKLDLNVQPAKKVEQVAQPIKKIDLNANVAKKIDHVVQPAKRIDVAQIDAMRNRRVEAAHAERNTKRIENPTRLIDDARRRMDGEAARRAAADRIQRTLTQTQSAETLRVRGASAARDIANAKELATKTRLDEIRRIGRIEPSKPLLEPERTKTQKQNDGFKDWINDGDYDVDTEEDELLRWRRMKHLVRIYDRRYLTGVELVIAVLMTAAGIARVQAAEGMIAAAGTESGVALPEVNLGANPDQEEQASMLLKAFSKQVLRRKKYMIRERDTLVSIAEDKLFDGDLAWLILELNSGVLKQSWQGMTCIVEATARQQIELPAPHDVEQFHANSATYPDVSNLVTIVQRNGVDAEVVAAGLQHVVAGSNSAEYVIKRKKARPAPAV